MVVISMINMKGGVGKTTLTTNICDCLVRRHGQKVLLVDIDPQFNATQCLFTGDEYIDHLSNNRDTIINIFENTTRTIADSVKGISEKKSKPLSEIEPVMFRENFYFLPGNLDLYRIEMAPGSGRENRLKRFLNEIQAKYNFDYVIIDTPPTPSVWMTSALLASDYYLIPVKPDPISYIGIDLLEAIINDKREDLNLSIKCIGLVLTMVERDDSIVYQNALSKISQGRWNDYKYQKYIQKRADVTKYQLDKLFILDYGDNEIKASLTNIVDELIKRIKTDGKE